MRTRLRGQRRLLLAALLMVAGGLLPWLYAPVGPISGLRGAGLWTFYAGFLAFAGGLLPPRFKTAALVQAVLVACVAVALPVWQVWHVFSLVGFGGWAPGPGLVLTLGGGVLAAVAARELLTATQDSPKPTSAS